MTARLPFQSHMPIRPAVIKLPKNNRNSVMPFGSEPRARGEGVDGECITDILFMLGHRASTNGRALGRGWYDYS